MLDAVSSVAPDKGWTWFIGAGVIGFATAAIHVFAGQPGIMNPLYASSVPVSSVAVLDVVWQQVTALLLGGAVAAGLAAFRPEWRRPVAWLVGGHYLVIAVIFIVWSVMWFGYPWALPQWVLFLLIAGPLFIGLRLNGTQTR